MSKLIATKAIRGAHNLVARAEKELKLAIENKGPQTRVELPNTGYYLPISHGLLGLNIDTLGGLGRLLEEAQKLLPPLPDEKLWLPYLGHTLDAGMATLFADELIDRPIFCIVASSSHSFKGTTAAGFPLNNSDVKASI